MSKKVRINPARLVDRAARSVESLAPALLGLEVAGPHLDARDSAVTRGWFSPDEDDVVRAWFARYLTARAGLLEVIDDLRPVALAAGETGETGAFGRVDERTQLEAFVVAYTSACLLVRAARHMVDEVATDTLTQRKLNEAEPRLRIPRKQYTAIYRSMTSPWHAWQLLQARRILDANRSSLDLLGGRFEPVLAGLRAAEPALEVDPVSYTRARVRYRWHAWRRRRASALQQGLFGIFEAFGRVIAEMRPPWHRDRVGDAVRGRLEKLLRPGDVVVTRHDRALSNLFLPGFWPHVALHIGPASGKTRLELDAADPHADKWIDPLRVLEARKDGVLYRPLDDTLAVDAVTILRPKLGDGEVAEAIARAISHEGKLYDFEFDFFRSDRLVCTEVVYRAYDGVGGLELPLTKRAGRPTLSAEDIVGLALAGRGFEPVAVYGTPRARRRIREGAKAKRVLERLRAPS